MSWQKTDRINPNKTMGQYGEVGERQAHRRPESDSELVDLARRAQREIEGGE